ncbi:Secretion system C-terminal sorting domain [Flavobacteriaceae bacterium]
MKKNLLASICTFVFIASGFSQENVEQSSKLTAKTEDNKVVSKKTKTSKPDKKTKELRKKLAYFQEHSPFKKTILLSKNERKENGLPPNKYYESEWELTMSPTLGRPTTENLEVVKENLKRERQRMLATGRVPGDDVNNSWVERGPSNVGGRTRAIMYDPNDATRETVFAGGVSGGLWKNTAISNANSQWTRVNIPENLNVSCLISDPISTTTFYAGTGESYTGGDANGNGVWKSTDRGLTWNKVLGGITGATTFQSAANLTINSPVALAGNYPSFPNSSFGPAITSAITGNIVLVTDGVSVPTSLGCSSLTNGSAVNTKIALVRRGSCNFSVKVANAQAAGAIAVIVMNNVAGPPAAMGGTDATITIPSVMISREDGNLLEAALTAGTTINGALNPTAVGVLSGNIVPGVQFVNKIAIRNNAGTSEIFVAAADSYYGSSNATTYLGSDSYGVYKSSNGGSTWTQLTLPLTANGNKHCPNDIEIGTDNKIWVSTTKSFAHSDGGGKVFSSTDGGSTFVDKYTVTGNGGGARVEIEASGTNANTIYVLSQLNQAATNTTDGVEVKIIKTTDGFATSTVTALPTTSPTATRTTTYGFTGAQAFYDLMIEADPTNDQIVYVGGIDLYRSANGCTNWTQISNWSTNVHSDQHAMTFKPGSPNIALFGNDGGVYYAGSLSTATSNSGITSRNNGFNVTQFYSIGVGPTTIGTGDYFTAGAQDNGSQYFAGVSPSVNGSSEVQGGDGAFCMFDQGTDNYYITNYVYNQDINSRSTNGTSSKRLNYDTTNSYGAFISPMALDSNKDILFSDYTIPAVGTTATVYGIRRYTNIKPGTATTVGKATITNALITNSPTALTVSKYTTGATTLLAGFRNGKVLLSTNANTTISTTVTWTDITSPDFVGSVSDVEFGNTENDIFVTFHNYNVVSIWYSADRGVTWQNKEGNFPDIPVKCILQNPILNKSNEVIIGTDLGVWFTNSFNTASPVWYQSFNGMSNVKVTDLDLRSDNAVYAATYGRGVFSGVFTATTLANEDFSNSKGVSIYPNPSNGQFNININQYSGKVNIQVADLNGREVYNVVNELFNSEKAVDLKMLESGIYVLRISGEDLNYSQKIIKN